MSKGSGAAITYTVNSVGSIDTVTVVNAGINYSNSVLIVPNSQGYGAEFQVLVEDGNIKNIKIISGGQNYTNGNMMVIDKSINHYELLPDKISSNEVWKTFADKVELIFQNNIYNAIDKLKQLRSPEKVEKEFIGNLSKYLGLDLDLTIFRSPVYDSLTPTEQAQNDVEAEDQSRRTLAALYEFYNTLGTDDLARFLSYVKNTEIKIFPLWSNDYTNFSRTPGGTTIYEGGTWFFTPHVEIEYNVNDIQWDSEKFFSVFYALAPVHLVIEKFLGIYKYQTNAYIGGCAVMTIHYL